jgi:hypothetical protein
MANHVGLVIRNKGNLASFTNARISYWITTPWQWRAALRAGLSNAGTHPRPACGTLARVLCLIACGLVLMTASGCAVGNKHQYAGVAPDLAIETTRAITVAVQDQRPYVLDGDKTPNFVGIQRGGFGNPFDVTTASGNALSSEMATAIVSALEKKNVNATATSVSSNATATQIEEILAAASTDRMLLVKLIEWKSDTYQNTALIYDVRLFVVDATGSVIAENAKQGRDDLGGSFMNPPAHAKTAVPAATRRILEGLLNDPKILAALGT